MDVNVFKPVLSDYKTMLKAYLGYTPRNEYIVEDIINTCLGLGWTMDEIQAAPHRAVQAARQVLSSDILLSSYMEWT